jgi:hypothetical protein
MRSPVFDKQHKKEYLLYGSIAAVLYMIPVWMFLSDNEFKNLYYLFIGAGLFMFTILFYAYKLVLRPYEQRRTVSMLTAGHLATFTGVAIAVILVLISVIAFFPHLFSAMPPDKIMEGAPVTLEPRRPAGLLFTVLIVTIAGNGGVGSFISIITAYAGRKKQDPDKS